MRIVVDRSNFFRSLGRVHRVVERRNSIPILANILLKAEGSCLQLQAMDLDIEVVETTSCFTEQPGATTVPAHLLYDIVRKFPDGSEIMLALQEDGKVLHIISGKVKFQLQCLPEGDFPRLSVEAFDHVFSIDLLSLKYLLDSTQFAISTEETRFYLNGIYFHIAEQEGQKLLRAVATDGHRLALAQTAAPEGSQSMPGVIIPRKTVAELQRLLAEELDEMIQVEVSETKIRFVLGSVLLTSKLIDGTFPQYERVIPLNNDKHLQIDNENFTRSVDCVSTISMDKTKAVKLSLAKDLLTLTVTNPDSGTAQDQLPVHYAGEALDIGFNAKYLLDVMSHLEGSDSQFFFSDANGATLVRPSNDKNVLYVLMPMRV